VIVSGGFVRIHGCRVHGNVAESLRSATAAAGGGVWVQSGEVLVERSSFRGNLMGGLGLLGFYASGRPRSNSRKYWHWQCLEL
jgi:hypothetical protein